MIDEEVAAAVLAIVIVAGIIASIYFFFGENVVEPFSELAILRPNKKLADYPTNVSVNETIRLYLYVGNHEGKNMYYLVLVKLGNKSTLINETTPANFKNYLANLAVFIPLAPILIQLYGGFGLNCGFLDVELCAYSLWAGLGLEKV